MTKILTLPQTKAQLEAMLSFLQPLVDTENMATLGFGYGVCSTAGGTAAKTVDITDFILYKGAYISVLFQNAFTVTSPTLNVNNKGAKPIKLYGSAIAPGKVRANTVLTMVYDGTNYNVVAIESQAPMSTAGAVDLGLPSGLLWCEHNVGASRPEEFGLYFSWGNVTGHAEGSGYDFSQTNYDASAGAALTGNITVDDTYDMAHHNMGGLWRLPRPAEFSELNSNCDHVWIDEDGVQGMRFTLVFGVQLGFQCLQPGLHFHECQSAEQQRSQARLYGPGGSVTCLVNRLPNDTQPHSYDLPRTSRTPVRRGKSVRMILSKRYGKDFRDTRHRETAHREGGVERHSPVQGGWLLSCV